MASSTAERDMERPPRCGERVEPHGNREAGDPQAPLLAPARLAPSPPTPLARQAGGEGRKTKNPLTVGALDPLPRQAGEEGRRVNRVTRSTVRPYNLPHPAIPEESWPKR